VELMTPQATGAQPCVIEIESQQGKLPIELNGTADELATIGRSLWESLA